MPRPTDAAMLALQRQLQIVARNSRRAVFFPIPRAKRSPPPPSGTGAANGAAAAPPPPQVTLWPYQLAATVNGGRTTIVSQKFTGPIYLLDGVIEWANIGGPAGGVSMFYSQDATGAQFNGSDVRPSGTPLFVPGNFDGATNDQDTITQHYPVIALTGAIEKHNTWRFGQYIPLTGAVYLKVSVLLKVAGVCTSKGYIRLIENADPAIIGVF